ncbi:hypothetical protein ACIA8K_15725 [Catenuloplanes sp. NPDC051500]|uniref:hypothetical protein n=1 Tax=Catenuloplanes sp. NPDC051500 TaxID=3363959 RepID=UPI0037BB88D9
MTSSPETGRRPTSDRKQNLGHLVAVLSLIATVVGVYFAWAQLEATVGPPQDTAASTTATLPTNGKPTPGPATGRLTTPVPVVPLDSLSPEKGGGSLTELPRPLRDADGYAHPLAIACPSNAAGDAVREVSYALSGRYLSLNAMVRPYYEPEPDRASVTHVTVSIGTRQRDGTMVTREAGAQRAATMAGPQPLAADLEKGDLMTIRVQCQSPTGVIVLTDAGLSPTG